MGWGIAPEEQIALGTPRITQLPTFHRLQRQPERLPDVRGHVEPLANHEIVSSATNMDLSSSVNQPNKSANVLSLREVN
jgi:hypothetical protein